MMDMKTTVGYGVWLIILFAGTQDPPAKIPINSPSREIAGEPASVFISAIEN